MKIQLRTAPRAAWKEVEVKAGTSIEDIYRTYRNEMAYTALAARVDNKIEDLGYKLEKSCRLELLDMRTQSANLIYQHSLSLIYLKAVSDCLGNGVRVEIQNSLNKGLYTEIKTVKPLTTRQVQQIEERMRQLVDADLPFVKEIVSREDAMAILEEDGRREKQRMLSESLKLKKVKFYSLEGCRDFFYGFMAPSTGYIEHFQLMKYRRGVLLRFPHPSAPDTMPPYVDEKKMYQAFGEQTKWDRLLGVSYVADLNEKIENGQYKELIQLSEALHEKKIAQIADMIKKQHKRIVLIAGPSSSGKTTFARRLCIQLKVNGLDPLYLGTDDYFVEREETPLDEHGEKDYENLQALDIQLFNDNMNALLEGREVDLPSFDFLTGHKVYGGRRMMIRKDQPVVIEGIHALNEDLTPYISKEEKFKIYISPLTQLNIDAHNRIPTTDERMLRRMVRDNLYRGHNAQSTIASWPKVRAGEDKNIFPYSGEADVLFNSYHVYEIAVLKKYAEPFLSRITPDEPEYAEAVRMLKFLRFFRTIEDDHIIAGNSIIREFIGGSIFVE
ncbi:nucleoside kinase [Ihubacter sp. rT4E-8]|uniref:uridine kinase family protein n=1 Tax=Ihubacter sp. rT4E-8 TaxID=3242369 RepID=UPI003CEBC0D7